MCKAKSLILVQNRRGHRPPPWGFFGGGIETGETPLQAVIREASEELSLNLSENDLEFQGQITGQLNDLHFQLHVFLWAFDGVLDSLVVNEGSGMELISSDEMLKRVEPLGPDYEITCLVRRVLEDTQC
ncbi:MAG: NUDIX domain-containing protein [Deinococcota bacterium]